MNPKRMIKNDKEQVVNNNLKDEYYHLWEGFDYEYQGKILDNNKTWKDYGLDD